MGQIAISGSIAGITINHQGAVVKGMPLENTYEEAMRQIAAAEKACKFALGDLLVAASDHYGDKFARWSEVTGFEVETLWNIASVCRRVPIHQRRVDRLSFNHHTEVAALPPAEQKKWLDTAAEEEVSVLRLRKSIKLGRVATAQDMGRIGTTETPGQHGADPTDTGYDNIHPHVNRLSIYLSKKEREGEFADMDAHELYRFHLDVLPVINRYGRLVRLIRERNDADVIAMLDKDIEAIGLN